jgi:hypothetical protein
MVTIVPHSSGPFLCLQFYFTLLLDLTMQPSTIKTERRLQSRKSAVLPVRVRGIDAAGATFDELAHTLNFTPTGLRLGAIRRQLNALDTVAVFYRQRRMEFKVIWTRRLTGQSEYQVGLQASSQAKEGWAMNLFQSTQESLRPQVASGVA